MNNQPHQLCRLCRCRMTRSAQVAWPSGQSITVCDQCRRNLEDISRRDRITVWQACNKVLHQLSKTLLGRSGGGRKTKRTDRDG